MILFSCLLFLLLGEKWAGTEHFGFCRVVGGCRLAVGGFGTAALWCARQPLPGEPGALSLGCRGELLKLEDFLLPQFPSALQEKKPTLSKSHVS